MNTNSIIGIAIAVVILLYLITKKATASTIAETEFWRYGSFIQSMARKYGVPAKRIASIILVESALKADAVGTSGERGLMQLKEGALADVNARYGLRFTFNDLFDDLKNIEAGTAYLAILLSMTGTIDDATRAYNVGIGTWKKNRNSGESYLSRVLTAEKSTSSFF